MNEHIELPTEDLRALFDIATCSMDFSSGFLDTEEVNTLRRIAVLIGVDPMDATPYAFAAQYPHPHQSRPLVVGLLGVNGCRHCRREPNDPVHTVVAKEEQA